MIPLLVALGIAAFVGTAIVVTRWDDIIDWLNDLIPRLKAAWQNLKRNIHHAAMIVYKWIKKKKLQIKHMLYCEENGEWTEETTTRIVAEEEVPEFIKNKIGKNEKDTDITREMEEVLQLEI
ncbi:hypothetical protein [Pectinatus haikarae]|uniref:Uncharacterized protein n=1 Tax=Pectinatus haikarae TaxID=349096 RepID=A0ABT9Y4U9_9FIRM|nr:hypothetical protein [Pectinatus haikarae]MDQ0202852.1 hypothetical protein [Pectinatus haikarae]